MAGVSPLVELRRYSGNDFPLFCDYQVSPPGRQHGVHLHDGIELVFVVKGTGTEIIAGVSYPILAGDLYVIDVGATHQFSSEQQLEFFNLMFKPALLTESDLGELRALPEFSRFFMPTLREGRSKLSVPPATVERITRLFSRLTRELAAQRPGYRLLVKALFIDLVITLSRLYREDQDPAARADGWVARALGFIHEHYPEPISVEALAAQVGFSAGHFGEMFKARTGTNVIGYLNRVRVERSCALLEASAQSITEIALACGYEDVGYFARVFKRLTGETPRAYRGRTGGVAD